MTPPKLSLYQRIRAVPSGNWTQAQQFAVRHLLGDLEQEIRELRREVRALRVGRGLDS